jgi:hypothetical protein
MSFEIYSIDGETHRLRPVDAQFVDARGRHYCGFFDGSHVVFGAGDASFIGHWIQGTDATEISGGGRLMPELHFTFMDHGPPPQRLHAVWNFNGAVDEAIAVWKSAGFSVSHTDRRWNRNHPDAIHLRTCGTFVTGADSAHVIIPTTQSDSTTRGDIHVGEFNPLTGFGIGFALHQLEPWILKGKRLTAPSR